MSLTSKNIGTIQGDWGTEDVHIINDEIVCEVKGTQSIADYSFINAATGQYIGCYIDKHDIYGGSVLAEKRGAGWHVTWYGR